MAVRGSKWVAPPNLPTTPHHNHYNAHIASGGGYSPSPRIASDGDGFTFKFDRTLLIDMRREGYGRFDRRLFGESLPVLLASGVGLALAGLALQYATEHHEPFKQCPALVVLVPVLLGLKCCLELTLASRLSTASHNDLLGGANAAIRSVIIRANIGLVLVQAIAVALLACAFSIAFTALQSGNVSVTDAIVLLSTSVVTAYIAALLLGLFTVYVILESTSRNVDPDNISGPLVASLGDLLAIGILVGTSSFSYAFPGLSLFVAVCILLTLPLCLRYARMHRSTSTVVRNGWSPIIFNLCFSCISGMFLESDLESLGGGLATLIPIVNGTGGNVSSVYSSRYATALHKGKQQNHGTTFTTLMAANAPVHVVFFGVLWLLGQLPRASVVMMLAYQGATAAQVFILLMIARWLGRRAWSLDLDPDSHVESVVRHAEFKFKEYEYKRTMKNEKLIRSRFSKCRSACQIHAEDYLTTRCVRKCASPSCHAEIYAFDEIEEDEVDIRLISFKGCIVAENAASKATPERDVQTERDDL